MVRHGTVLLFALSLVHGVFAAEVARDVSQVERRLAREPQYQCDQPLYGLVVFGAAMKTRVWIVLDKSVGTQSQYDVAYVDLNANGDLTDDGERFAGVLGEDGSSRFKLPDITEVATGATHTEFSLRCSSPGDSYQMVSVKWNGKQKFGGGYTANPDEENYSCFARSAGKAPILWLNGDGPFTFQRWYTEPLRVGGATDVKLFIGVPGVGTSTFCAFQVHALPGGEGIQGVLHYTTRSGEKRQSAFALLDKC